MRDLLVGVVGNVLTHVVDVVLRLAEQCRQVVIVQGVGDDVSAAFWPNKVVLPQKAHLVRDSRFADANEDGQVSPAQRSVGQPIKDPRAGRIAKCSENSRHTGENHLVGGRGLRPCKSGALNGYECTRARIRFRHAEMLAVRQAFLGRCPLPCAEDERLTVY
jgi:hypothetical protein